MLSFFRRIINSKAGVVVTFIVLGVIAIAFAAGDVSNISGMAGGLTGSSVAKVGDAKITANDLRTAAQNEVAAYRQEQPTFDMAQFMAAGGFEGVLQREITGLSLEQFGKDQGMVVSRRLIDGQIASIPAFRGPNGQFDPALYQQLLAQRKMTDVQVRTDLERTLFAQQLTVPTIGATQMAMQMALPYASLLLEKRGGEVGFIPTRLVPTGPAPSDGDIQAFYTRNVQRYTLPERRVVRYALVTPAAIAAKATPSEAEIARYYQSNQSRYAAAEKRDVTQVIVADQAGANALAAKAKGGTSLADAARAAGLEASVQKGLDKAAYAALASAPVADAVFAAAKGTVVGPVRGTLGFVVARVDGVTQVPGKTLAQVRPEIVAELTKQKQAAALGEMRNAIEDSLSGNATFEEVVADRKLQAQTTPAVTAQGTAPDAPAFQPTPEQRAMITAAFTAEEGDAPQLVPVGQDGGFAIVGVGQIQRSAPRPLAQVRAQVLADLNADRARAAARKLANAVLAKVNKGMPMAQALKETGLAVPPVRPIAASRRDLAAAQNTPAAAPLALLFSMPQNKARTLEAPQNEGWYILRVTKIEAGNATGNDAAIRAARGDIGRLVGREYVSQFARAVRDTLGVKTDPKAIAKVRSELLNNGGN
ncbi:peptidyl-prolyl cis-trans isomerase D [Sphingomonas sp. SORGH_AS870]|uniref:peptidylprolyl isomerase n=1 Tax=Sphingomonas sp. SORGH_AS_0870 TaxID=3041801 RepID=UPI00285CA179|nr:SurA N-terminal domain-containing protein [Sphingomonas sp. SORGH_AS_0870]MDR6147059.1 peptidyl-prolyl cis-trans isomerase D [Sphingomonas sp. SORGH_AS_0870]